MEKRFVIYSSGERGYWDNDRGWVDVVDPERTETMIFTQEQVDTFTLPVAEGVAWVEYDGPSKATPGPWSVVDGFSGTQIVGTRNGRAGVIVTGMYDEENEPTLEELSANAVLISLAPRLLAALENLVTRGLIRDTGGDHFDEVTELIQEARGAGYGMASVL